MNYSNPQVTVLMPVYNGEKFLSEAIESILHQTFTDFEFLIINDGSTDQSVQIIEKYNDPRIRLIHNQKNLGLSSTLNRGLDLAQGQYIARMDCDDISHPERLKKQVEFMDSRPETGVCGTWIEIIGEKCGKTWKPPTNYEEIKISLLFDTALVHSSVMIRKSKFREYNLYYNPDFLIAQDFELWSRCSNYFPLANLPEVLLKYRVTSSSHFHSKKDKYPELLEEIYRDILVSLNINLKKDEYKLHRAIGTWSFLKNRDFIRKSEQWLQCLKNANSVEKQYFEPLFSEKLANRWFWICYNAGNLGFWTWKTFWRSSLSNYNAISWKSKLKFILLQIMKHKIGTTIDRFIDYYTSLELPDLNQSQWWSLERLEKFQNKRLQTIIKYAYNNIPGYRTKFEEGGITPRDIKTKADLYKLPITVREEIQDNPDFMNKSLIYKSPFYTGGSTGTSLKYYESLLAGKMRWNVHLRGWSWNGYNPKKRLVLISSAQAVTEQNSKNILELSGDLTDENLKLNVEKLLEFKPQHLRGYVGSLYILAKYCLENNIRIEGIKSINPISENLYDYQRKIMKKAFNCEVFEEYCCNDGGACAWECNKHDGLHYVMERAIIEEINGEMIVTDLWNLAMPFIRYRNGDSVTFLNKNCNCGRELPLISVKGRTNDIIITPHGPVSPSFLMYHGIKYDDEQRFRSGFRAVQYVQKKGYKLEINIVKNSWCTDEDIKNFKQDLDEIIKGMEIILNFVKVIPQTKAGKRNFIINEDEELLKKYSGRIDPGL